MLMHHMLYSLSLHLSSSLASQTTQTHLKAFHQHYHIIKTIRLFLFRCLGSFLFFLSTPKNKTQKGGIFSLYIFSLLDFIHLFCSFFSSQQVANSSNVPFACCVADVWLNKLMAGEEITRI